MPELSAGASQGETAAALSHESIIMNTKITTLGAALLAVGCFWSSQALAQTSTTVTTTNGAFTEYVPGSETMVVRSETGTSPLRYSVTKQTTIVDESGAPVAIDRISPGSQLSIQYTGSGDRLVASRVVVQRAAPRPACSVSSCCAAGGTGDYNGHDRAGRNRTTNQYHHDNNPSSHARGKARAQRGTRTSWESREKSDRTSKARAGKGQGQTRRPRLAAMSPGFPRPQRKQIACGPV